MVSVWKVGLSPDETPVHRLLRGVKPSGGLLVG